MGRLCLGGRAEESGNGGWTARHTLFGPEPHRRQLGTGRRNCIWDGLGNRPHEGVRKKWDTGEAHDGERSQGERVHRDPHVLPDGRVLFVLTERGSRIEAFLPSTGQRRYLTDGGNPIYLLTGHLVLARGGTLFAAPLDLQKLELTAPPVPVLEGVRSDGKTYFAVGREGTLAYVPAANTISRLVWVDRQGKVRTGADERRPFSHPRLSPDGTRVVLESHGDIWVYELG